MKVHPLAITTSSPCSFLSYCISQSASRQTDLADTSTSAPPPQRDTIIICSTRNALLREILIDLGVSLQDIPSTVDHLTDAHKLISHSPISTLLTTDLISMVYCPTIHHLRAYISSLTSTQHNTIKGINLDSNLQIKPYLAIHGVLPLHHLSTEWSAQGLSRTLSSIIDAAKITSHNLLISVSSNSHTFGISADLPLINSRMMKNNTKKKGFYGGEGFEDEESGQQDLRFVGKVKDVFSRWCKIIHIDKPSGVDSSELENEELKPSQDMLV
ncbi:hypothetical protein TWF694_001392 [Orbilia ellipsospora]|uniref:Uncharacterized protein n=1 Tax=Orbilia ellipsospora TaxID=2528407 RepID=A0AAV9XSY1_9PEZI